MSRHNSIFQRFIGVFFIAVVLLSVSCNQQPALQKKSLPLGYLKDYVSTVDSNFKYNISDSIVTDRYTLYHIKMFSGEWLTSEEVHQTLWWHWVDMVIPKELNSNHALLFIGGGSVDRNDIQLDSMAIAEAVKTQSVIAHISNVPFQPLNFKGTDDMDRYEDNIIAYGWERFLSQGAQDEHMEWLARFPMTRAVVRAMDVVEEITAAHPSAVENFVISGASKRGWTTWTTAAVDERVVGMAPLVIDMLNVLPSFQHHFKSYGDWSPAVENYVNSGIMDWMGTPEFDRLLALVEPFQFKEVFDMPKLVVNGTIDEFFLPDSWQFYWDTLPEPKYLQYVPNGNHGLAGTYRSKNVYSFYHRLLSKKAMPQMEWKIHNDSLFVDILSKEPYSLSLWQANNPLDRDFRIWEIGETWEKSDISVNALHSYAVKIPEASGYTASLIEVVFDGAGNTPITLTTGTVVKPDTYPYGPYEPKR